MNGKRTLQILVLLVLVAMLCGPAAAKTDRYVVPKPEQKTQWFASLAALVCLAGVGVVAFKNARRSRLD